MNEIDRSKKKNGASLRQAGPQSDLIILSAAIEFDDARGHFLKLAKLGDPGAAILLVGPGPGLVSFRKNKPNV